jgi:2-hydroxy-6-oxonona-2,4-dienedioate hydrolase
VDKAPAFRSRRAPLLAAAGAVAVGAGVAWALWTVWRRSRAGVVRARPDPPREVFVWVRGLGLLTRAWPAPASETLPMILVHGYGISGRYLVPIGERLAAERAVYAPDLPGHGRSDDPERVLTIPELADVLAAWMSAAGIARAALLGNSMGCQIVAELALRHPERVDRLVLVGPTADPRARSLPRILPRFLWTAFSERLSLVLLVAWDFLRAGLPRLWRELDVVFADRLEDKLGRIAVPVLIVRGGRDRLVSEEWAEELAGRLREGQLQVVPGGSHALHYGVPDELMRLMRPFLEAGAQPLYSLPDGAPIESKP